MSWPSALLVAVGGALGSVLRYAVGLAAAAAFGAAFPWGTLAVNLAGSFAIGAIAEVAASAVGVSPPLRLFLATGICGGFTTFSTFTLDALDLTRDGAPLLALTYIACSVIGGLIAVYLGLIAARLALPHT